jgi:hypothetical protein
VQVLGINVEIGSGNVLATGRIDGRNRRRVGVLGEDRNVNGMVRCRQFYGDSIGFTKRVDREALDGQVVVAGVLEDDLRIAAIVQASDDRPFGNWGDFLKRLYRTGLGLPL